MIKTEKMNLVASFICDYFNVNKEDFYSRSRLGELVEARKYFCYFSREMLQYTLIDIGKHINRDHASVIHHHRKLKNEVRLYNEEKLNVEIIERELQIILGKAEFKQQLRASAQKIRMYRTFIKEEKDFIKSL